MKKAVLVLTLILFSTTLLFAEEGDKYGKPITLSNKTMISQILSNGAEFEGKKVLIEGTVVNVCKKAGCWIELASDKEMESVIVKVDDGVIVFPMEAKGKTAVVEGEVYSVMVTEEACVGDGGTHECGDEEKKDAEDCEHEKVKKETKKYMIKGIGAVIK